MNKKPLIIIAGPTAVGKSDMSIKIAKAIGGEIISADSIQAYKHMDIGSAKITSEEMQGVNHYGIDILDPRDEYSVADFKVMAVKAIDEITARGNIPIIVGGTGFYIQSVIYDIDFNADEDDDKQKSIIRTQLEDVYKANPDGETFLHDILKDIDPESAKVIHKNNVKRVIRAIEYYKLYGERISVHNEREKAKETPYNLCFFVMTDERDLLYSRIDKRVDKMVDMGLIEEVAYLKALGLTKDNVSMQGLGYKEILEYLDGDVTLEDALYKLKRDTRHFAKRQLTWFRREKDAVWINRSKYNNDDESIYNAMLSEIKRRMN